jgi:hypothetical protein
MAARPPCHGHWALPHFSRVYPNHLVCLYHFDYSIPSDLAVTTASLRALGIALCWFRCTVMVPYEWVRIVGSYLFHPTAVHSMMSWSKECGLHSSSLMFSIPVDPVRCGLSPFCLFDVLFPVLRFPLLLWRADQWKVKPVSFLVFLVLRA